MRLFLLYALTSSLLCNRSPGANSLISMDSWSIVSQMRTQGEEGSCYLITTFTLRLKEVMGVARDGSHCCWCLPQLFSILIFEIRSLVEPRTACSAKLVPESQKSSHLCLPNQGITGAWSTSGFFNMGSGNPLGS